MLQEAVEEVVHKRGSFHPEFIGRFGAAKFLYEHPMQVLVESSPQTRQGPFPLLIRGRGFLEVLQCFEDSLKAARGTDLEVFKNSRSILRNGLAWVAVLDSRCRPTGFCGFRVTPFRYAGCCHIVAESLGVIPDPQDSHSPVLERALKLAGLLEQSKLDEFQGAFWSKNDRVLSVPCP